MNQMSYSTRDFRLATWLYCQPGIESPEIRTEVRGSGTGRYLISTFVFDVSGLAEPLQSILRRWSSEEAVACVHTWEQRRRELLSDMKSEHNKIKESEDVK